MSFNHLGKILELAGLALLEHHGLFRCPDLPDLLDWVPLFSSCSRLSRSAGIGKHDKHDVIDLPVQLGSS